MTIFKACDIRGVVGDEWDAADALAIGRGLARLARTHGNSAIAVAGDFRRSTPALKQALIGGITQSGSDVIDLGQCPTPVAYFAARDRNVGNIAIVTASHNPGRYNGVKFMIEGRPALPETMRELQLAIRDSSPGPRQGQVEHCDPMNRYETWTAEHGLAVSGLVRNQAVPTNLSIVLDTMNGACTYLAPSLLRSLDFRVTTLCEMVDPDFSKRTPNPAVDRNLDDLVSGVRRRQADVGIALDGDGDRVVFVDSEGTIIRPEQIASLLIRSGAVGPTVVYDLKCASLVPNVTRDAGGKAIMRPSGHGFIKTTMIDQRADWGVEVSGHHFFRQLDGGDDGLFTAVAVLGIMIGTGQSLRDLVKPFPWPLITPDLRFPFSGDAHALIESIAASCGDEVSRLDGVRATYAEGWGLARISITEPAITFRFEGRSADGLRTIAGRMLADTGPLRQSVLETIHEWLSRSTDRHVAATG